MYVLLYKDIVDISRFCDEELTVTEEPESRRQQTVMDGEQTLTDIYIYMKYIHEDTLI